MSVSNHDAPHARMMTKVAHLYHDRGLVQSEIAKTLGLSQARVSRLLSAAEEAKIVRTVVAPPAGLYGQLESEIEQAFQIAQVHIVDSDNETEHQLADSLARALVGAFEILPIDNMNIGFASQSNYLRRFVEYLTPFARTEAKQIVEILGDVANSTTAHAASNATQRLAELTHAAPVYLRMPALAPTSGIRSTLLENSPDARECVDHFTALDLVVFQIENSHSAAVDAPIEAAAQLNQRFIDSTGMAIETHSDERVIGISLEQLRRVPRRIGVSGGVSTHDATLAALRGQWVNVLITDEETASYVLRHRASN